MDACRTDPRLGSAKTLGGVRRRQTRQADSLVAAGAPVDRCCRIAERRAIAFRNRTAAARHFAVRGAIMTSDWTDMHSERWFGDRTRRRLGRHICDLGNLENEALGIELGYRYDKSPVICYEAGGQRPAQRMDVYTPGTWPGTRPPSVFLQDGRALFDLFGSGFTLLRFADRDVEGLTEAAADQGVPFEVVDVRVDHAHALDERDLVLLRPDQHVVWQGDAAPTDPVSLIGRLRGHSTESHAPVSVH